MQKVTARTDCADPAPTAGSWSLPLPDPFPAAAERLGPRRIEQIVWAFIALGIIARLVRYLLWLPLWPDEAYLAHNFLHRGYLDLMKSLDFIQIAPLLYLWVQATFVKVFGFSEYSLRLYTLLCGIGSLLLFWRLAGRVLRGTAFLLAVGTFAVAYPLVRHSAEAKPYGADVFVSMVMLTLLVEWLRRPQERRWAWAVTLAMPLAVGLSYPAVFFAGGIVSVMAIVLWRRGSGGDWLRWGMAVATLSVGLAALFAFSAGSQLAASGADQRAAFADVLSPAADIAWKAGSLRACQHERGPGLSGRRCDRAQPAVQPLLSGGLSPLAARPAIFSGRALFDSVGAELRRGGIALLSLRRALAVCRLSGARSSAC